MSVVSHTLVQERPAPHALQNAVRACNQHVAMQAPRVQLVQIVVRPTYMREGTALNAGRLLATLIAILKEAATCALSVVRPSYLKDSVEIVCIHFVSHDVLSYLTR